ncbi:MAG: hypothetical protein IPP32_16315 [Bacteroidetes bacterium]|nr:hypothetical protein [Bacteroidota bacterium]
MKSKILLRKIVAAALLAPTLLLHSCVKEEYNLNNIEAGTWNPNIAIPLVYTNFSINDIVLRTDKTDR